MDYKANLLSLIEKGKALRNAQYSFFKASANNKKPGQMYVDTRPLLEASKAAEKAFDNCIMEIEKQMAAEQQPELNLHA